MKKNEEKGEENLAFHDAAVASPPPAVPLSGTPPLSASSPVSHSHQGFTSVPLSPDVSPTAPYFGSSERQASERSDPTYSRVYVSASHSATAGERRDPPYNEHDA